MTITEDRPASNDAAEVGKARARKEDQRLITGRTKWTDNIVLPGMLPRSSRTPTGKPPATAESTFTGSASGTPRNIAGKPGTSTRMSTPRAASAAGSAPHTSARPPVFNSGNSSAQTCRTFTASQSCLG